MSDSEFCELIKAAQNGAECAITLLAKDAQPVIYGTIKFLMSETENVEDVKDVTQECLARIFRCQNLQKFRTHQSFQAWKSFLRREAFFRVQDHWRKQNRAPQNASLDNREDTDTLERVSETAAAVSRAKDNVRDRYEEMMDIIRKTGSKRDQDIALLYWLKDLSQSEIAKMYDINIALVSTIISRIKKSVKDKFKNCILLVDGLLLHSKQVALWIVPQLSCLLLSSIIFLLAGMKCHR